MDWNKIAVAVIVLGIYGAMHVLAFVKLLPEDLLKTLIGSDGALAAAVVYFYFGSSQSSQNKDATIAKQLPPPPPQGGKP